MGRPRSYNSITVKQRHTGKWRDAWEVPDDGEAAKEAAAFAAMIWRGKATLLQVRDIIEVADVERLAVEEMHLDMKGVKAVFRYRDMVKVEFERIMAAKPSSG